MAVAADAHPAAGADDLGGVRCHLGEVVFPFVEPEPAQGARRQERQRREAAQLGVVVGRFGGVEKVLRPRAAVGDQQRWRVAHAGAGDQLHGVGVQIDDGEVVLVAAEAVDGVGHVELHVQGALGGGHQLQLMRGLGQPLALAAVAGDVGLEVVNPVVVPVAGQHRLGMAGGAKLVVVEDAGAGGERPGANQQPSVDQVFVGQDVRGARLHVEPRGDPVGEVGQEAGVAAAMHPAQHPEVGVGVHVAGQDGLAG